MNRTLAVAPVPAAPLLYAVPGAIHDGDTIVHTTARGEVGDVARVEGGYVLSTRASDQEPAFRLYVVSDSGETNKLADTLGSFAVSPDGRQVASMTSTDLKVHAWDVTNGAPRGTWRPPWHVQPNGHVAYAGRVLVVGANTFEGKPLTFAWRPSSTSSRGLPAVASPSASGRSVAGLTHGCLTALRLSGTSYGWTSCDLAADNLTGPEFSPNGKRVLAYPAQTDGFGPGSFSAVDVRTGRPVATFLPGDWTYGARWADDRHLWVSSASTGDATDTIIRRCDLAGECTTVVKVAGRAVVGRP